MRCSTPQDFWETACSSAGLREPAPGIALDDESGHGVLRFGVGPPNADGARGPTPGGRVSSADVRVGLPIAVLLALLILGIGAFLWLRGPPASPGVPVAASPSVEAPRAAPAVELPAPELRSAAPAAERGDEDSAVEAATAAARGSASVAGWLRVEGRAPREEVELRLGWPNAKGGFDPIETATAQRDGSFRFEDVADDWDGAVLLPDHYLLARPEEHGGRASTFPARAGQVDLVLDVLRRPLLRGRVLTPDRTPLANAYVLVDLTRESSRSIWSASAGPDGRFQRALPADPPLEIAITCRGNDGGSLQRNWNADSLPPRDAFGDIDLGDLALEPAERASVLVLDPEGAAFEGASVSEIATTGNRTVESGPDGRAEVILAPNVEGFEVLAPGFRRVELARPAAGEELVARLIPTNALIVEALDAQGRPWPDGQLRLRTPRLAFEGDRPEPSAALPGEARPNAFEWGQGREGVYVRFRPDARGRWVLTDLVDGLDLELALEDALGMVADDTRVPGLARGERRTVRLQLAGGLRRVAGRCVDARGEPVVGAKVSVSLSSGGSSEVVTDDGGVFESPPFLAERVDLRTSAKGYADRRLQDVATPADLTLVLQRGRTLDIALRGADGAPTSFGQVHARIDGAMWTRTLSATGHAEFENVVYAPFEIEHVWHERSHHTTVPAGVEDFVWELPATGQLQVEVAEFPLGELESGYLALEALDARGAVEQRLLRVGEPWSFRLRPWPGRYRLHRVVHAFSADAEGWRTPAGEREVGDPVEVEVVAGETQRVVVEAPR